MTKSEITSEKVLSDRAFEDMVRQIAVDAIDQAIAEMGIEAPTEEQLVDIFSLGALEPDQQIIKKAPAKRKVERTRGRMKITTYIERE